jgi:hypothetical protein
MMPRKVPPPPLTSTHPPIMLRSSLISHDCKIACVYQVRHWFFNQDFCFVPFRVLILCPFCILQMG